MRAVTWTQVAQYIIMITAFLVPTAMIGHQTGNGWFPQFSYGTALAKVEALERQIQQSVPEREVRDYYREQAEQMQRRLDGLPTALW